MFSRSCSVGAAHGSVWSFRSKINLNLRISAHDYSAVLSVSSVLEHNDSASCCFICVLLCNAVGLCCAFV